MENYADRSKWTLEPFDVERAKRGDLVCTREGVLATLNENSSLLCSEKAPFVYDIHFTKVRREVYKINGTRPIAVINDPLDLRHPVPVKEVKKKRIAFDASRVGEEGVEVICRDSEAFIFVQILTNDPIYSQPIVARVKSDTGEFRIKEFFENGRHLATRESVCDLFLLVPDTEPALPSMQEVAEKLKNSYLGHAMIYLAKHANPLADKGPFYNRMTAKIVVECLAEFLNDGWEPDWANDCESKYHWCGYRAQGVILDTSEHINHGSIFFKSEEAANYAREILNSWEPGDAILKRALGVNA